MKPQFIPYNKELIKNAKENRKNPTVAEKKLWRDVLSNKQFTLHKFTRQKPLDNFIVDFYCSELLLVIEVDGDTHANQEEYDKQRSRILLEKYNIQVIRYYNSEVLKNIEGIRTDLLEKTKQRKQQIKPTPQPPLSGGIRRLSSDKEKSLVKETPPGQGASLSSPPDKGASPVSPPDKGDKGGL